MLSIKQRRLGPEDDSLSLSRGESGGLLDLILPTAMRRVPHFLLAVALNRSDLRRFDLLLHRLMEEGRDGPLKTSYRVKLAYTCVRAESLRKVLSNALLPDVIHELTIRLEDGRRSIEVTFSRRGVVSRVMGGAFDESWEAESQKALSAFLAEMRAKFLTPLFALVALLLGGSSYMIYLMATGPNALSAWTTFFYLAYILVSFTSAVLFWMHQRGVLFPHAKISVREAADGGSPGNDFSIIGLLSLVIQVVRLIADYFIHGPHMFGNMRRQRQPGCGTATAAVRGAKDSSP